MKLHTIKLNFNDLAKEFGEGNLLSTYHLEHVGKLTLKNPSDVVPKSIMNRIYHLKRVATQQPPNETVDKPRNLAGEDEDRPAKKQRVSATNRKSKGTRVRKGRKGKAKSAADAPNQKGDICVTIVKSDNQDTHDSGSKTTRRI